MKRTCTSNPDVLRYESGGGVLSVFGIPFLLAGVFIMLTPTGIIPMEGDVPPPFIAIPFGAVFALVGLVMVFGRAAITIDRRRRMVGTAWTLIVPVKQTEYLLDYYGKCIIGKETHSHNGSHPVYPVSLVAGVGAETVTIDEPVKYEEALALAEEVARFTGLLLADETAGAGTVRAAEHLDESIRDEVKQTKETVYVPPAPVGMKSRVREESRSATIEIPPPGFGRAEWVKMAIPALFALAVLYFFLLPVMTLPMPGQLRLFFFLFVTILLIALPLVTAYRKISAETGKRYHISVTPELFRLEVSSPRGSTKTEIPAAEVEEVTLRERPTLAMTPLPGGGAILKESAILNDGTRHKASPDGKPVTVGPRTLWIIRNLSRLTPPPAITVRSDRIAATFGEGLSEDELRYLHGLIRKMLARQGIRD